MTTPPNGVPSDLKSITAFPALTPARRCIDTDLNKGGIGLLAAELRVRGGRPKAAGRGNAGASGAGHVADQPLGKWAIRCGVSDTDTLGSNHIAGSRRKR